MSKFSWEPLSGGSLLLRVVDGDRTTTWRVNKNTGPVRTANILIEAASALMSTEPSSPVFFERTRPMVTTDITEVPMATTLTEAMSRAAQADRVADLHVNGGKWWTDDLDDLELKDIGHGDPEVDE